MAAHFLKNIIGKVLVVSCIYEKIDILEKINQDNYDWIILNGNICSEGFEEDILSFIREIRKYPKIIYNLGNSDLLYLIQKKNIEIINWLKFCPNVVIVEFRESKVIITNGGLTPTMKLEELKDNLETSFVSLIDGISWHELYHGGFGYVISNLPLTLEEPKFYPYSLQMGNLRDGKIYGQEIDCYGMKETFILG